MAERIGRVVLLALLGASLLGCGGSDDPPGALGYVDPDAGSTNALPEAPLEETPRIGLSVQNLSRTFFQGLESGARSEAELAGAELILADAGDDAAQQLADVQRLIDEGVHGIVLSPVDSGAAVEAAELARANGVPIVAVANQIGTVEDFGPQYVHPATVALVTNDDVDMGRKAAAFVADAFGDEQLEIAVIEGKAGAANAVMRRDGFTGELDALAVMHTIVASEPGDWTGDGGAAACASFAGLPSVDLVFSMSDAMTAGCVEALEAAGLSIPIVSIGGNASGVELLADGRITGTVCQKPGTMGALAVATMIDALVRADYDQGLRFYETPVVTADNQMQTCIPQW